MFAPKARNGFRSVTQIDPLDFLIFSSLVFEIAKDVEKSRIPTSDEIIHSYRIKTNKTGQLFDPSFGYRSFLEKCKQKITNEDVNFVCVTDISDFYLRIYHHRLENALSLCTKKTNHVKSIMNLLHGWNNSESFGIPVGSSPARVLSECLLNDVDNALLANQIDFLRFNDDYRIFASSQAEAYKFLSILAETLYSNHGLTLQQQKTKIINRETFSSSYLYTARDKEIDSLQDKFDSIASEMGLNSWYEPVNYFDLSKVKQETIDSMNLCELFREEISKDELDLPIIRFILRRLTQINEKGIINDIFENIDSIYPAFPEIIQYFKKLRDLDVAEKVKIGKNLLKLIDNSILSQLDYHKIWILNIFSESREWENKTSFLPIYKNENNESCRRELILAMGRAKQTHWFQSQWRHAFSYPSWSRRALLLASSCLAPDARKHWYSSIENRLDIVERAVVSWARRYPFQ